jgi:hypothetical protein
MDALKCSDELRAENKPVLKRRILLMLMTVFLIAGCQKDTSLSDFRSDGCSLFPDRNELSRQDWCECCFEHDIAYWKGGTEEQRLLADNKLRECVIEKTGNTGLADLMFEGVRFGGSPYFYNWYRWGYGWSYDRKYEKLTEKEEKLIDRKLSEYFEGQPISPCSGQILSK